MVNVEALKKHGIGGYKSFMKEKEERRKRKEMWEMIGERASFFYQHQCTSCHNWMECKDKEELICIN